MGASLGHTFPTWRLSVKVGDLVKYNRHGCRHYLVLRSPLRLEQVFVQALKTGNRAWLNKSALEVISESR